MRCKRCKCSPCAPGCPYSATRRPDRYSYYTPPRDSESNRVKRQARERLAKLHALARSTTFEGEARVCEARARAIAERYNLGNQIREED